MSRNRLEHSREFCHPNIPNTHCVDCGKNFERLLETNGCDGLIEKDYKPPMSIPEKAQYRVKVEDTISPENLHKFNRTPCKVTAVFDDKTVVYKSDGSTASYYELPEGACELQDIISYKNMNGQIAEIFRACMRYGEVSHSSMLRDAKKMAFYSNEEVKRLERYGD